MVIPDGENIHTKFLMWKAKEPTINIRSRTRGLFCRDAEMQREQMLDKVPSLVNPRVRAISRKRRKAAVNAIVN